MAAVEYDPFGAFWRAPGVGNAEVHIRILEAAVDDVPSAPGKMMSRRMDFWLVSRGR